MFKTHARNALLILGFLLVFAGTPPPEALAKEKKPMATIAAGSQVQLEYTLKVDSEVVDTSKGGEPLKYTHGQGQLIPGLEKELAGMAAGQAKEVTVAPDEAYGPVDSTAYIQVPKDRFAEGTELEVGSVVTGRSPDGRAFQAKVFKVADQEVTLDLNHPLAGKTLYFEVKVVEVKPAA